MTTDSHFLCFFSVVGFWELMFVGKPDLLSPLGGGGLSEVLFWTIVLAPALP
jgi:hypothetical protein